MVPQHLGCGAMRHRARGWMEDCVRAERDPEKGLDRLTPTPSLLEHTTNTLPSSQDPTHAQAHMHKHAHTWTHTQGSADTESTPDTILVFRFLLWYSFFSRGNEKERETKTEREHTTNCQVQSIFLCQICLVLLPMVFRNIVLCCSTMKKNTELIHTRHKCVFCCIQPLRYTHSHKVGEAGAEGSHPAAPTMYS